MQLIDYKSTNFVINRLMKITVIKCSSANMLTADWHMP